MIRCYTGSEKNWIEIVRRINTIKINLLGWMYVENLTAIHSLVVGKCHWKSQPHGVTRGSAKPVGFIPCHDIRVRHECLYTLCWTTQCDIHEAAQLVRFEKILFFLSHPSVYQWMTWWLILWLSFCSNIKTLNRPIFSKSWCVDKYVAV